jgi:hypothetical protein
VGTRPWQMTTVMATKSPWRSKFSERLAAILGSNPLEPKANDVEAQVPPTPARDIPPLGESSSPGFSATGEGEAEQKQLKTATELAEMIEYDLARHPDCPKAGFRVTVYGWPYW